ncbi:MAG TPA: hypothetical protein VJ890_16010 [Vineibacter sp.]|nr:hypothetical protein [Vineibacter sp.]
MLATLVTVILDAFSGVSNPTWSLSDKDAAFLQDSVNRVVQSQSVDAPKIPGLGYRGLVIQGLDVQGKAVEVRIFRSWIIVGGRSDPRAFQDKDNALELWLVDTGRAHVPPNRIPDVFPKK